jgi:hypothetical protein
VNTDLGVLPACRPRADRAFACADTRANTSRSTTAGKYPAIGYWGSRLRPVAFLMALCGVKVPTTASFVRSR